MTPPTMEDSDAKLPASTTEQRSFEDSASFLSQTLLLYLNPLFEKGFKQTLEQPDLGPCSEQDRADKLYERFQVHWAVEEALPVAKRSLWRALFRTVGYAKFWSAILLFGISTAEGFGPILILNILVQYLDGTRDLSTAGLWVIVSLLFFLPMSASILASSSNVMMTHIGLQFRNILINKIYRKSLLLSPAARQISSTGQIVNMFSADTMQLYTFVMYVNNAVVAAPVLAVALWLLYRLVGVGTFVGLGMLFVFMPLIMVVFVYLNKLRTEKMLVTDQRVKLMNDILTGIRVLKFYAWERAFQDRIVSIRQKELALLKKAAYVLATVFTCLFTAVPVFMPVVVFYTYVKLGNTLDAATAFTAISLFNLMHLPFMFLPIGLSQYSQASVSIKRLMQFFAADELKSYVDAAPRSDNIAIELNSVTLGWLQDKELENMDLLAVKAVDSQSNTATSKPSDARQGDSKYTKVPSEDAESNVRTTPPLPESDLEQGASAGDSATINRSVETLRDVSVSIKKGELVAIVGPVGCGKSSFLNGILGELNLRSGSVSVDGSVAYCDQRPWILNDTVQGNILFGKEMEEGRFDEAMYASCLEDDVKVLPGGLLTQIGEKGINLSGGQKARVALARAVYKDADIYLLDDPLSAVDAHVAQFLFHECICRALKGKTRILVTHHIHLLPRCDKVIVLVDGAVKVQGTYDDILKSGIDLNTLAAKSKPEETSSSSAEGEGEVEGEVTAVQSPPDVVPSSGEPVDGSVVDEALSAQSVPMDPSAVVVRVDGSPAAADRKRSRTSSNNEELHFKEQRDKSALEATLRKKDTRTAQLITQEEKEEGDVTWACYSYYIRSGGLWLFFFFLFCMIASQLFVLLSSYWLQYWGSIASDKEEDGESLSTRANVWYLNIFCALSAINLGFYVLRSLFLAEHRMSTSDVLHLELVKSTLNAPIAFFDTTPVGRILNRFSSDMRTLDEDLSHSISQVSNCIACVLGAVGAIAGATKGTFLILMIPLTWFYHMAQKYYRATNTAVARLESVSRSPIYADFSQALAGVSTLRAFKEDQRFITTLETAVNANSIANVTQFLSANWLAIRLDLIGSIISFFIAAIAAATDNFLPAGFIALGLSFSFQLTTYLKYVVRMIAIMEAQMNSVERIMHYMNHIDQEQAVVPGHKAVLPPADWPERGVIEAQDLQMRYRDGPLVLKGVSFETKACEKVGIAGRTGSGKSSLMIALFRIQELSGGTISIDGIDTASVPLHVLRSRLGIIPQDPVMFSASVRFNLDPFDQYSDEEIWQVLEKVNMKDHVLSLPGKLEEGVAEGGDNFSVGQRQLICIGRAILRKPKILVLDEATASIDNENDQMIQQMVRAQFQQCTVLTIAHRLNTIVDSDRIMVLDYGVLKEMDKPDVLIANEHSLFAQLWQKHLRSRSHTGAKR